MMIQLPAISPQTARDVATLTAAELLAGAVIILGVSVLAIFRMFWTREKELVTLNLEASRLLGEQLTQLRQIPEQIRQLQEDWVGLSNTLRNDINLCKEKLERIGATVDGCGKRFETSGRKFI